VCVCVCLRVCVPLSNVLLIKSWILVVDSSFNLLPFIAYEKISS